MKRSGSAISQPPKDGPVSTAAGRAVTLFKLADENPVIHGEVVPHGAVAHNPL
jgi:hypothetical protein